MGNVVNYWKGEYDGRIVEVWTDCTFRNAKLVWIGKARDVATNISVESKYWQSQNGAKEHALSDLSIAIQEHLQKEKNNVKKIQQMLPQNDDNKIDDIHIDYNLEKCDKSIKECLCLKRIKNVLSNHSDEQLQTNYNNSDIVDILNNFNHLLFKHKNDEAFKYIYSVLGGCNYNIEECDIFHRHHRSRKRELSDLECLNHLNRISQIHNGLNEKNKQLMLKISYNIIKYPNNNKYHQLNLQRISNKLNNCSNCMDVLYYIGFIKLTDAHHVCTRLVWNKNELNKIKIKLIYKILLNNNKNDIHRELIDKIHCHFMHSYDIGYRYKSNDNKIKIKLNSNHQQYVQNEKNNKYNQSYDFSQPFYYWDIFRNICKPDLSNKGYNISDWYIKPKYNSFKQEMLFIISIDQWNNEFDKALINQGTDYCKQHLRANPVKLNYAQCSLHNTFNYGIDKNTLITVKHLIAVQLYCGYSNLCTTFSASFRRIDDKTSSNSPLNTDNNSNTLIWWKTQKKGNKKSDQNWKDRQSNFHHLAKYLIEAVNLFSKPSENGDIKIFYHGINSQFTFDCIGKLNYQPLSTSSSYEVALQFSGGIGMILKMRCHSEVRYFDCSWLSDFSHENECLFIQSPKDMMFLNITNVSNGVDYVLYIEAFTVINKVISGHDFDEWFLNNDQLNKPLQLLTIRLIKHQLKLKLWKKIDKEMEYTLNNICNQVDHVRFKWDRFDPDPNKNLKDVTKDHAFLKYLLCKKECQMMDLDVISDLFPNLRIVNLQHVRNISCECIKYITNFVLNNKLTSIKLIIIESKQKEKKDIIKTIGDWMYIDVKSILTLSGLVQNIVNIGTIGADIKKYLSKLNNGVIFIHIPGGDYLSALNFTYSCYKSYEMLQL